MKKLVKIALLTLTFGFASLGGARLAAACPGNPDCKCGHGAKGDKKGDKKECDHKNCDHKNCEGKDCKHHGEHPEKPAK